MRSRLHEGPQFLHPLSSLGRRLLREGLFDPHSRLGRLVAQVHTPFDVFERTSDAVARGNRKVFAEIRESLDAPYDTAEDLDRRLLAALGWRRPAPRAVAAPVGAAGARAQRHVAELLREIITKALMVMSLPGRILYLGANLDEPVPPALAQLTDAELTELLARFEPQAGAPDVSGALDWSVLEQRMHYIVHLFRALHLHEDLLDPPYTPEQVAAFSRGAIPDGVL